MTLRKISDPAPICTHPEHNPPNHMVLSPGIYEWECSGCGEKKVFVVEKLGWELPIENHESWDPFFQKDTKGQYK